MTTPPDPMEQLVESLARLREELVATSVVVRRDLPPGEISIGAHLHDALEDLAGWIQQGFASAVEAAHAEPASEAFREHLLACEQNLWSATRAVFGELASEGLRHDLARLAASAPAWGEWVGGVLRGIDSCRGPMLDANEALFGVWPRVMTEPAPARGRAS